MDSYHNTPSHAMLIYLYTLSWIHTNNKCKLTWTSCFWGKKASIIPEDKYNLIIQYLRDPTGCRVDPNFKFWVKDKKFAIKDLSGIGVADVVVAPVPQSKSKVRIFDPNIILV